MSSKKEQFVLIYLNMNKFAERLRELRLERGISRMQFANDMFVSVRLVSYWESGKRECDFDTLLKISNYFNESIDYLLGKVDD